MAKTTKKTAGKAPANTSEETTKTPKKKAPAKKKAAAKKTTKKVAAQKTTKKKVAAKTTKKKASARKTPVAAAVVREISADERHAMIAEAAYLRGESMGFLSDERQDWLHAEAEVDARLAKAGVKIRG